MQVSRRIVDHIHKPRMTGTEHKTPEFTKMLHYQFINAFLKAQAKTERGASLVEYALLVALIAVVCITAVTTLGQSASSKFDEVESAVSSS